MNCPVCKEVQLVMSERQGIEIDYCPQCRGVWLDRGELDKIIDRSSAETPTAPAPNAPTPNPPGAQWQAPSAPQPPASAPPRYAEPRYTEPRYTERRDNDDYRHGKRKKRGGLLGDLFDFDS